MTRATIGGPLDMAALARLTRSDADARAREHAPRTPEELRAAVAELAGQGYAPSTIAVACGIAVEQVKQLLGENTRTIPEMR